MHMQYFQSLILKQSKRILIKLHVLIQKISSIMTKLASGWLHSEYPAFQESSLALHSLLTFKYPTI